MRTLDRTATRPQIHVEPRPALGPADCCSQGCDAPANDSVFRIRAQTEDFDVCGLVVCPPGGVVFQSPKLRFCDTHADALRDADPDYMVIEFR